MNYQEVCNIIFKLYLYADAAKMVHYSIDTMHGHELADEVRNVIIDFTDDLAEQFFGYYGKPRFGQLTIKHDINVEEDINKLSQHCINEVEVIREEANKNTKLSGIVSLIDSFKEKLSQKAFLATFDKVSNYKLGK